MCVSFNDQINISNYNNNDDGNNDNNKKNSINNNNNVKIILNFELYKV